MHARRVTFIDYSTFAFVSAFVTGSALTILVIVAHRPGSAAVWELFFDEFSDLLERTSMYASSLIIVGDLNIHLDVTSGSATVKFLDILDQLSLVQHVIGATHRVGHCLDVFITRREMCVRSVDVSPSRRLTTRVSSADSTFWSHRITQPLAVTADVGVSSTTTVSTKDLCQSEMVRDLSTLCSASELFDHSNTTLRTRLEVHAPVKTVCVRAARTAPWYDEDCRREKKETRRLEKLYRRTTVEGDKKLWQVQFKHQWLFFNRNSMATGLQRSTRAEVTQRLYGRNCGLGCRHHHLKTQVTSLLMTLLSSSRRRLTRFELQLRALHHL